MTPLVEISVEYKAWETLGEIAPFIEEIIAVSAGSVGKPIYPGAEVSLLLCDDAMIKGLNRDWRKIDKTTNVLSFPTPGKLGQRRILGDIAISFDTLQREAESEGKTLRDHLAHLVIHGFLHLLDFDHETVVEAELMESWERLILAKLGISDPYADSTLVEAHS